MLQPENDPKPRQPQDATRINVRVPEEVAWWCAELDVTAAQLIEAVRIAGASAAAVRRILGR